jgi:hypothetical protein
MPSKYKYTSFQSSSLDQKLRVRTPCLLFSPLYKTVYVHLSKNTFFRSMVFLLKGNCSHHMQSKSLLLSNPTSSHQKSNRPHLWLLLTPSSQNRYIFLFSQKAVATALWLCPLKEIRKYHKSAARKHMYISQYPLLFTKIQPLPADVFCSLSSQPNIASTLHTSHWEVCEVDNSMILRSGIW